MEKASKVTVIIPTYNRPGYLPEAIASVLRQTMDEWLLMVVNDGGEDVESAVKKFNDPRVKYHAMPENRGKAACLNFALANTESEYIAYLDDDDIWYKDHLSSLSALLDEHRDAAAAYSDLYETTVAIDSSGKRHPIQKSIRVSREFNRSLMFHYNHVLHVSAMHRRSAVAAAGGYDEKVRVLIDWNIHRKLAFFGDFIHLNRVTGEYNVSPANSDRISDAQRRDMDKYRDYIRLIKADLPPKPWPKVREIAAIYPVSEMDARDAEIVEYLLDMLDYPCRIILPDCTVSGKLTEWRNDLPRLKHITITRPKIPRDRRCAIAEAARNSDAEFLLIADRGVDATLPQRIIRALECLDEARNRPMIWESDAKESTGSYFIRAARAKAGQNPPRREDCFTVASDRMPAAFIADDLANQARVCESEGDYATAEAILAKVEEIGAGGMSRAWLANRYSSTSLKLGKFDRAARACRQLLEMGYRADNLATLGEIHRLRGDWERAAGMYLETLEKLGLSENDLSRDAFPIRTRQECQAFKALVGLGECFLKMGRLSEAAGFARLASRLSAGNPRPYMIMGGICLAAGEEAKALEAYVLARNSVEDSQAGEIEAAMASVHLAMGDVASAWKRCAHSFSADAGCGDWIPTALKIVDGDSDYAPAFMDMCEKHLALRPGNVKALAALARMMHINGKKEKAKELAERAAILSPGSVDEFNLSEMLTR